MCTVSAVTANGGEEAGTKSREELEKELHKAELTIKKLEREIRQINMLIERNRIFSEAKDSLSRVVTRKKSELEKYMRLLLENCPSIIMIFDKDGRLLYCTDEFLKATKTAAFGMVEGSSYREILSRYTPAEFLEKADAVYQPMCLTGSRDDPPKETVTSSTAPDEASSGRPVSGQAASGQAAAFTTGVMDFAGTGNPRAYSFQITPMLDEDGCNIGALVIFYDTTELLDAQHEAEKANKAKSDFLATVSHEIRTPMNAVIGMAHMLKATKLSAEQQGFVANIQNSSNVLLNLINDILDFSKIEAGKLELVNDNFSFSALLDRLKTMFELLFAEKDLRFQCVFAKDIPQAVFGDEKRLGQIISNLLSNALKYTRTGGVIFRVSAAGTDTLIEIEDSGIGIKAEAIPKLFTAFEQLDLVRNKQVQGTGLGLAITKKLCELMNGSISVQSEYNKGTVFTVRLPLEEGMLTEKQEQEALVFTAPQAKVLLVDDIDINLEVAAFMLSGYDIAADVAKSGKEALDMAGKKDYDLILMDHMMPEMDGVEAIRHIRSMKGHNESVPVIALTANAVNEARAMFLSCGFNGMLPKPMENAALAETLLKWLPGKLRQNKKHKPV